MAVLMITHDLGVIAEVADRVAVMYAGKIVEAATASEVFARPRHPYTLGLMASIPKLGARQERLPVIPGTVPDATRFPSACRFAPRCAQVEPICRSRAPKLLEIDEGCAVACWMADGYPADPPYEPEPR